MIASRTLPCLAFAAALGCAAPIPEAPAPAEAAPSGWGLREDAAARGLVLDLPPRPSQLGSFGGSVVAEDLDGDGDIDVSTVDLRGGVTVFENDGAGGFEPVVVRPPDGDWSRLVLSHCAVQAVGDARPDLLLTGFNQLYRMENLGGLSFGPLEVLVEELTPFPTSSFSTVAAGDADGDGDLDLLLPGMSGMAPDTPGQPGTWDLLLIHRGGGAFDPPRQIGDAERPTQSFAAVWTDRDLDGDQDLLVTSVSAGNDIQRTTWWVNVGPGDGGPELLEEPLETAGFEAPMGIARADLDGDGRPDYCLADMGPAPCYGRVGDDWLEHGVGRGLTPANGARTIGWSLELEDLDNDGVVDAVMAAGHSAASYQAVAGGWTEHPDYILQHPDVLWLGRADGDGGVRFDDRTEEQGFGDVADHYGAAAADFDGDGALDVVLVGNEDPAALWMSEGATASWLEVELEGPPGNPQGLGARVTLLSAAGWQEREILGQRGYGQGPSRAHFGLGEDEDVDAIEVLWSDGALSELAGVEARQVITLTHP